MVPSCSYYLRKVEPQFSDHFLALEVADKDGSILCTVVVVYVPRSRSVYISQEREYGMWEKSTSLTYRRNTACSLVVAGDLNTHLCDLSFSVLVDGPYDSQELVPVKYSDNLDRTPNNYRSKLFLDYAREGDLISLNGLNDFDKSFPPRYTFERRCHSSVQRSTIDYCLVRSTEVSLISAFGLLDRHLGISDDLLLSVEIKLNTQGIQGERPRLTPSDQPKVRTNWATLVQQIIGPLTSSFTSGVCDGRSALLEMEPNMVARQRIAHLYQPQVPQCDPHSSSLRENLKENKAAYSSTCDKKARRTLAARMRRTVRFSYTNEHLTSSQ
ncbi:hypothetical protein RvY_16210 [Ramazzottius varieornatus]|uniref:Endonuclease/exonuclease/phosphatase domain-containing protein n=1 Tax=Ramazzottius varieornatus TaxID=947166 RepID=A0A1D1W0L4_RAMVA|nr:hypothetical protein RvY_16210 [Ramazzottius varieornatus]